MRLHDLEFRIGERSRLLQDRVRNADLADIVQPPGQAELLRPATLLAQLDRQFGGKLAHTSRMLARIRIAILGDGGQPLERLVVLLFQILGSCSDQLLELGGPNPQEFGLITCSKRVVRYLQRLDAQVGVAVEDLFVNSGARLAMRQGVLELTERFEDLGKQTVGDELHVGELVVLGNGDRLVERRNRTFRVASRDSDPAACDLHCNLRRRRDPIRLTGRPVERLICLVETRICLRQELQLGVGLREVRKDLCDVLR